MGAVSIPSSKVSWFEMPADDLERAAGFYRSVFGWATPPMGDDGVFALTTSADEHGNPTQVGGINGGIHRRAGQVDAGPVVSIAVADLDSTLAQVVAAGGRVVQPRTEVPEFGLSTALFADTEGNVLGVYRASAPQG